MSDRTYKAFTETLTFCAPDEQAVLTINPGVPVSVALELATQLLAGATRQVMEGNDYPEDSTVTQHLLETSKALMQACLTGIWAAERGEAPAE